MFRQTHTTTLHANKYSTQNAIDGMDKKTVERLHPINDVRKPNKNEPKITPIAPMAPIQDISEEFNLPVFKNDNSFKTIEFRNENQLAAQ